MQKLTFIPGIILLMLASIAGAADRPNIVLIMADDLGFADLGCCGGEIETPNLDALAENGLRFSPFYNTAKCHSSRVALLTGLYCGHAGDTPMHRGITITAELQALWHRVAKDIDQLPEKLRRPVGAKKAKKKPGPEKTP
jgi:arylsulfatase A-like enzyme